jgi:chemotaxis protein methyltransferase CheR/two-component system CheB/CheR fusion protein
MIIHHQDPDHPSLLQEILQSYTEMPVVMVEEGGLKALPNTVYPKPPDYDCSILQGSLILLEPVNASGTRMAIDIFFWHLVEDQDGKAVGIILSGMGSDGTLDIRALKEHMGMGMAMAQDPPTARFSSMPQSAIAASRMDYIALPNLRKRAEEAVK